MSNIHMTASFMPSSVWYGASTQVVQSATVNLGVWSSAVTAAVTPSIYIDNSALEMQLAKAKEELRKAKKELAKARSKVEKTEADARDGKRIVEI